MHRIKNGFWQRITGMAVFVTTLVVLLTSTAESQMLFRTSNRGPSAMTDACDQAGNCVHVEVFRGSASSGATSGSYPSSLVYDVYDASTGGHRFGYGEIPAADVTGNGTTGLFLDTDTSANPGFTALSCDAAFNCVDAGPDGRGRFTIAWNRSGQTSYHFSGSIKQTVAGLQIVDSGSSKRHSASAAGNVLGIAFGPGTSASTYAQIGTDDFMEILIQKPVH